MISLKHLICIPHELLLQKFCKMSITETPLKWFFNFLQGKAQTVKCTDGTLIGYKTVAAGAPQGSVLSPLMFGSFIRDLPNVLKHCKCTQYADDTQIYLHAYPGELDDAITLIEEDAKEVADWTTQWIGTKYKKDESNNCRQHAIYFLH